MAASVFLNSFTSARLPSAAEARAFQSAQRRDFQAERAIPLFWLAPYHTTDVRKGSGDSAYIVTAAARATERLWRRRRGILVNVGLRYADLFDDFRRIVRDEMGPYVLLRSGAAAATLSAALDAFTMLDMATEFPKDAALRSLIGFNELAQALGSSQAPYLMVGRDARKQWPREGAVYEESLDTAKTPAIAARWRKWLHGS